MKSIKFNKVERIENGVRVEFSDSMNRPVQLIEAAPEMLKALEAILEDAENFLSGEAQVNLSLTLVEAAIAKAKGGE